MAEEIDLEKCNFRNFRSPVTLTLYQVKVLSTCTIRVGLTAWPTTASRSTKIWPFEFHEISTFRELWTHMIAFLEGIRNAGSNKLQIRSLTITNHQFWPPRENGRRQTRKVQFSELQKLRDLDLGLGRGHTGAHIRSRYAHKPSYGEIGKTLWTYGHDFQ